jgi:glycosyltransferase involved in cell wall biosynthesis
MIIYISESLAKKNNGGSSLSGLDFLNFIRIKYKNILVLTNDSFDISEKPFYNNILSNNCEIVTLKRYYPLVRINYIRILKKIYYFINDLFKPISINLEKYYEEDNNNIIFVNSWSGLFNTKNLKNYKNFRKVCIVRGNPESFIWQSFEEDKNQAIINAGKYLNDFDELIFVSQNGLNDWKKYINPIKSYYLPNSINEDEILSYSNFNKNDAQKILKFSNLNYNVVLVSSIQERKGQDIILKEIDKIVKLIPNIKFHFVGIVSKIWGGFEMELNFKNSKYANHFEFYGHSDFPFKFIIASDLCLFTSHAEAFPRTIAEYMALGKPIVATSVSGIPEMIKHMENGILFDPNFTNKLTESILYMYENNEIAVNMGLKAKADYFNKFSKSNHIKNALKIFDEINNHQ